MMTSNLIRFYCGTIADEDNFMSKITVVCIAECVQGQIGEEKITALTSCLQKEKGSLSLDQRALAC